VPTIDTEWKFNNEIVKLKAGCKIEFYEEGGLKSFYTNNDLALSQFGTKVKIAAGHPIEVDEQQRIKQFTLAKQDSGWFVKSDAWTYRGTKYSPFTILGFSSTGEVVTQMSGPSPIDSKF